MLNEVSHLHNVSIVPITTESNSTQIAGNDKPDCVSVVPLENTNKIESISVESGDAMDLDRSSGTFILFFCFFINQHF